jgi:DUF1365 family protein
MTSCVYTGFLSHRRRAPVEHAFRHSLAMFYIDLDELPALSRTVRGFGVNRRGVFAFHDADHFDGTPHPTKDKVLAFLRAHGIDLQGGTVAVLTQCRMFGYVFNPVSFYYCHAAGGGLRAVVAEVNNTFGERHVYLLSDHNRLPHPASAARCSYATAKMMHVSPFISMHATYEFHFAAIGQRLSVVMKEHENGMRVFDAHLWGKRLELGNATLSWLALRYPFLTLKITAAIHWQAVRLAVKGAPFYRQPPPSSAQREQARLWQRLGKEYAG